MIGGLTYVYIIGFDPAAGAPTGDSIWQFADYNEAMSFAKWLEIKTTSRQGDIKVWNWNGGSGYWLNGAFTSEANSNYPSP